MLIVFDVQEFVFDIYWKWIAASNWEWIILEVA